MHIIDTFAQIAPIYADGGFDLARWRAYMARTYPAAQALCEEDLRACLSTGQVHWEDDYLPVLNTVFSDRPAAELAHSSFLQLTHGLQMRVLSAFSRAPECDIVLYLGLCNGAGWVTQLSGRTVVLLGLEKIVELRWNDLSSMKGLLWHELGHVYQQQFGVLKRHAPDSRSRFLWQFFTEGVAMVFEQELAGDASFFHQDKNGWKRWCDAHFAEILADFDADLPSMRRETQRWFGDWVRYNGQGDVGYYLGARFVRFALQKHPLDELIHFDIPQVAALWEEFRLSRGE